MPDGRWLNGEDRCNGQRLFDPDRPFAGLKSSHPRAAPAAARKSVPLASGRHPKNKFRPARRLGCQPWDATQDFRKKTGLSVAGVAWRSLATKPEVISKSMNLIGAWRCADWTMEKESPKSQQKDGKKRDIRLFVKSKAREKPIHR